MRGLLDMIFGLLPSLLVMLSGVPYIDAAKCELYPEVSLRAPLLPVLPESLHIAGVMEPTCMPTRYAEQHR